MPGVLSRNTRTGKPASSIAPTTTATRFTKVSNLRDAGKETVAPFTKRSANIEIVLPSRKRKTQDDRVEPTAKKLRHEPEARPIAPATPVSKKRKSVRFAEPEAAPSTPSRATPTPSSGRKRKFESDDPNQAGALLERLSLQSSPVSKRSKTTVHRRAPQNDFDLPKELLDLLDLHAAFLKTLNMQYAHNGTTSPIDLDNLYSSVTRTWGKRHVTLDDIQRCVGVLCWNPTKSGTNTAQPAEGAPFFLCDYGSDKICIEFHRDTSPGPLREPKLKMDFEANLRTLWLSRGDDKPATIFITTLPKAPIKPCVSMSSSSKTQTTLDAFKQSIALKKQQDQQAKAAQVELTNPTTGTRMSLLDRIRLKETILSQTPQNTPSPADLQRRSALHRAADVAAVIGMLCKATSQGQARVSFSMAALMVRLKDSVRTPVSQEDAAVCVRLLAEEVAPGWLRIVKIGGRENVVCESARQPTKAQVEDRVRVLLG
jgi:hypothetical protein